MTSKLIHRPERFTKRVSRAIRGRDPFQWRGEYAHPGPNGEACIHSVYASYRENAVEDAKRDAIREHGAENI